MPAYRHVLSGKVRELYETDDGLLLFVASDRVSAYDVVLPTPIPDKGAILTRLSLWWFEQLADIVPHHVVSTDVPAEFAGRAMLCRRLAMVPVECVARGYLAGSGLADYRATGAVCGERLPAGLVDGSRLREPIFTPATKAPQGEHDANIDFATVAAELGPELAGELRRITLAVYARAATIAERAGLLLADTKIELGHACHPRAAEGTLVLGDEVLTPDSSRFWPASEWQPGRAQPSYDKQYLRDWLAATGWDRTPPGPELPDDVVAAVRGRYVEAYEKLTGERWS
ncbi:MAG: phosphoribosylaminoimidazolesuccinocarboxamide synthase [Pseudonocardiales bacterium]|nr:MAG: phosphoribosylaminoimidazolesuccinocarboxamide synthase [Pseudonocardiales bacterium]